MSEHIMRILAAAAAAAALAGCWSAPDGVEPETAYQGPPTQRADHLKDATMNYQQGSEARTDDAVKTALMWADKAREAMDTVVRLQDENRLLDQKNKTLLAEMTKLQGELAQSRKELDDANDLLLEMRRDLDRWKVNVLGFRQELRSANQVQVDALRQVIILLGGQPTTQPSKQAARTDEDTTDTGT